MSTLRSAQFLPEQRRERSRMEFALPTINVIFLLMLYFLSAGTLAQHDELSVPPPQTVQSAHDRLPRPLMVIDTASRIVLDGRAIDDGDVESAAQAAIVDGVAGELNLLVPRDMPAAAFLALLARLDAAAVPVRLVTVQQTTP